MKWMKCNQNWKFTYKGNDVLYHGENPTYVNLPHDFSIMTMRTADAPSGFAGGYYQGGVGTYEKVLQIEKGAQEKVFLVLDGAYMLTEVFINGNLASFHPNGYTQNITDLTPWVEDGDNYLKIVVSNDAMPNSRWYTGSGIYRDVWLVTGPAAGLMPQDIFVETVSADVQEAVLRVKTRVPVVLEAACLKTEILGTEIVTELAVTGDDEWLVQEIRISDPVLWEVEHPHLYRLKQMLSVNGFVVDECEVSFGIRTISFDVENGFCLNGRSMKLKGGCIHHDNGILGSCSFYDAEYRKVKTMKELGYNAIRMAHNPASETLLKVCDELGMLVMEELYDQWTIKKNTHDYHLFFRDWWQRDVKNVVEGHRNHPSIIMWSTGNEIVERDGNSGGNEWARKLADEIRKYDQSRAVTNGICAVFMENGEFGGLLGNIFNGSAGDIDDIEVDFPGVKEEYQKVMDRFESLTEQFAAPLDVVGYNYLERFYERGHERFPNRVICGTESYPIVMKEVWEKTEEFPYVIGDFTWTAVDYLGESGIGRSIYGEERLPGLFAEFPWHADYCGDIDLSGVIKPQGEYRRRLWNEERAPYIAVERPENHGKKEIISPWGWEQCVHGWDCPGYEGKPIKVTVYTVSEEVVLLLNGTEVAGASVQPGLKKMIFEIPYQPGTLEAVAYEKGMAVGRSQVRTPDGVVCIHAEQEHFGSEEELIFLKLTAEDGAGNCKVSCQAPISVKVSGAAVLQALGNGNPAGLEEYHTGVSAFYDGQAMLVLRKQGTGVVQVEICGEGMEHVYLEWNV